MSKPSTDLSPAELWAAISQVPRPFEIVDFPRYDASGKPLAQVAMFVLTLEEQIAAAAEAGKLTRSLIRDKEVTPNAPDYQDIYSQEAALQVLVRACKSPGAHEPMFPTAAEVRRKLSADEIAVLFASYLHVKTMRGPIVSQMSDDDASAWAMRLKEAGNTLPLGLLSSDAHEALTLRLACLLAESSTDTTSAGEPPLNGAT